MFIIDNEKKQKMSANKIRQQIKIYFSRVNSVVSRVSLGIPATVYLSGTGEPSSWLGAFSVKFLEFKVFRLA